VTEWRAPSDWS